MSVDAVRLLTGPELEKMGRAMLLDIQIPERAYIVNAPASRLYKIDDVFHFPSCGCDECGVRQVGCRG